MEEVRVLGQINFIFKQTMKELKSATRRHTALTHDQKSFKDTIKSNRRRSSAIAEGPRDASCQLKSCQLPRNSAETTCTSPEQIEVMKLEG